MCNKDKPPDMQTGSAIRQEGAAVSLNPARRTRTKTRKPKFLSLRLELSPGTPQNTAQVPTYDAEAEADADDDQQQCRQQGQHQQLNLFPLHPENLVEDKDMHVENVAFLFESDGSATLNGLLDGDDAATTTSEDGSLSPSLTFAYRGRVSDAASSLMRTAMKGNDRDAAEEKWVRYSEVVEKREEEVTSCAADVWWRKRSQGFGLLSLKLDYQGILNAWSDKGPLYIEGESPATVPELHDEFPAHDAANELMYGGGSAENLWRVPDMAGSLQSGLQVKEELGGREGWKTGQREASVQRYKEKRQNRLFSKRIRYEVRKINAEKRPRMKGRFVKRN